MDFKYIVDNETTGKAIKYILENKFEFSKSLITKLKLSNRIFLNNSSAYVNNIVTQGDVIEANIDFEEENLDIIPQEIPIEIIFEDNALVIINKRPNIVVHPTSTHPTGTIANALAYHFSINSIKKKIRPVSRLDRDTSGIIIFAKNQYVQDHLIKQMKGNTFTKEYIGIVNGVVRQYQGTINFPIAREPGSIILRHISSEGAPSITHYKVLKTYNNATMLKFNLETGRTHQIRVHCKGIGFPLIGDSLYSEVAWPFISRQALHSYKVSFIHPQSKEKIELETELPEDIKYLLSNLSDSYHR